MSLRSKSCLRRSQRMAHGQSDVGNRGPPITLGARSRYVPTVQVVPLAPLRETTDPKRLRFTSAGRWWLALWKCPPPEIGTRSGTIPLLSPKKSYTRPPTLVSVLEFALWRKLDSSIRTSCCPEETT